jgi:hypothetical protein
VFLRPGRKDVNPKERALWADLMGLGMVFPIAIALGFFVGRWAGGLLGVPRVGMALGLIWGVATGFWELYKVTVRLNRLDPPPKDPSEGQGGRPGGRGDAGDGTGGPQAGRRENDDPGR